MYDASLWKSRSADIFNLQNEAQLLKAIRSFFDVQNVDGS